MDLKPEGQLFTRFMEVATLLTLPSALKAAIKLNVIEILAEHAGDDLQESQFLSAAQIAAHFDGITTSSNSQRAQTASSLDRMLRLLASHGLLASSLVTPTAPDRQQPIRTYGLNATSLLLTQKKATSGSLAPFVLYSQHPAVIKSYEYLHECILDGEVPFVKATGMHLFSYASSDAGFNETFNNAMASHSRLLMHSLLEVYPGFEGIASLVDVAGGLGACIGMITARHPHIKGINFDLPHVVADAPQYPGVQHVGGNMFETIPSGDAMFLKFVLHDWSDEQCLQILENCYKALPSGGKAIVVDIILPNEVGREVEARVGYQMDLTMFAVLEGAKERVEGDVEAMFRAAGFTAMKLICKVCGFGVMEFYKS